MSAEPRDEALERRVREAYLRPVPMTPLDERALLRALAAEPPPAARPRWERSGGLTLSLPAAAAAALLLMLGGMVAGIALERRVAPLGPDGSQLVHFALVAPSASHVAVVGDFNGWDARATPMRKLGSGATWTAAISVREGRYAYEFVIDGRTWMPDPTAPLAPGDGFGHESSVLVVPPSRSAS
jgi:hypothetical protein